MDPMREWWGFLSNVGGVSIEMYSHVFCLYSVVFRCIPFKKVYSDVFQMCPMSPGPMFFVLLYSVYFTCILDVFRMYPDTTLRIHWNTSKYIKNTQKSTPCIRIPHVVWSKVWNAVVAPPTHTSNAYLVVGGTHGTYMVGFYPCLGWYSHLNFTPN